MIQAVKRLVLMLQVLVIQTYVRIKCDLLFHKQLVEKVLGIYYPPLVSMLNLFKILFYYTLLKAQIICIFHFLSLILFSGYHIRNILFQSETHSPGYIPHIYTYTHLYTLFEMWLKIFRSPGNWGNSSNIQSLKKKNSSWINLWFISECGF